MMIRNEFFVIHPNLVPLHKSGGKTPLKELRKLNLNLKRGSGW